MLLHIYKKLCVPIGKDLHKKTLNDVLQRQKDTSFLNHQLQMDRLESLAIVEEMDYETQTIRYREV